MAKFELIQGGLPAVDFAEGSPKIAKSLMVWPLTPEMFYRTRDSATEEAERRAAELMTGTALRKKYIHVAPKGGAA